MSSSAPHQPQLRHSMPQESEKCRSHPHFLLRRLCATQVSRKGCTIQRAHLRRCTQQNTSSSPGPARARVLATERSIRGPVNALWPSHYGYYERIATRSHTPVGRVRPPTPGGKYYGRRALFGARALVIMTTSGPLRGAIFPAAGSSCLLFPWAGPGGRGSSGSAMMISAEDVTRLERL